VIDRVGGALRAAARRYGTPLFATDLAVLDGAAAEVRAAFPDPTLRAFSVKANDVAAVVAEIARRGFDANVVSAGEWSIARKAGVPNARITFEGIGKTDADLAAAVRAADRREPLRWLAVESLDEVLALRRIAARRRLTPERPLDLLFRLNPDVAPETIAALAVGAPASKFGMTGDELTEAVALAAEVPGLVPRGVHLHVGSQLRAVDAWRDAASPSSRSCAARGHGSTRSISAAASPCCPAMTPVRARSDSRGSCRPSSAPCQRTAVPRGSRSSQGGRSLPVPARSSGECSTSGTAAAGRSCSTRA
jgi:diaminopimelate decarboxylase